LVATSVTNVRDIANLLNLPKSADGEMIVKQKREGTTTMKPRPGKPHLMTNLDRRALKKVVARHQAKLSPMISVVLRIVQPAP
jgi:hypothetical protein